MATTVDATSQQASSLLPPCHIVLHSDKPSRSETSSNCEPVSLLPASGPVGSELLTPSNRRSNCSHASCLGGGGSSPRNFGHSSQTEKPLPKKAMDVIANLAVPRGYLDYWSRRVDEEAAEIPECEEFESAYTKRAQSLFPFRSSTTEWTVNTAGGFVVVAMPWGPIMMLIGLIFGSILGFGLSMANDMCRLRKKSSAATKQKEKIDHLIRWAGYHFASSSAQLQLVFKVIMEYEVLARLGNISKTARSQLRLLYAFLSRADVGHCLWLYLDYFEAHYEQMTRSEISMCALVCLVCTQCAGTLRKRNNPPVVVRMIGMMNDPQVRKIFQQSKTPNGRQAKIDERTERCLFYADNSQDVQTYVMKGGDLLQSLHKDYTAGKAIISGKDDSFRDTPAEYDFGSNASNGALPKELIQETLPGDLRPVQNFNVALTYAASVERGMQLTVDATNSSVAATTAEQLSAASCGTTGKQQRRKSSSVLSATKSACKVCSKQQQEGTSAITTNGDDFQSRVRWHPAQDGKPEAKTPTEPSRLFKNYEDLLNFDITLKHQTPIAPYEFQFLDEREKHDPNDPSWELTVDQPSIQVYKYISPNSPVVIVKAYATLDGIPLSVLSHNIKETACRLHWDTTFSDYRIIEPDVDGCEIIYCVMRAPFPISNRDFLQWRRTIESPGVVKMMLRSADHPSVPEKPGCVRAETLMSGYLMRESTNDPSSSTLFLVAQTDIKGLIPKVSCIAPLGGKV